MTNDVWQAEETEVRSRGMTYTNIPMGGLARPTVETIGTVLSIITNSPGKVFVHCQYGKDRTGTIVACYRMAHDGWTSEAAQREADRFNMSPLEFQMKDFIVEFGKSHPPTQK
jgi:protein-tyrosine phosphatase